MKKLVFSLKYAFFILLCLGIMGCASGPTGFLKPSEDCLKNRELQIRQYDTANEKDTIAAVAGVLQDLGFTLDDSETEIGFVAASKRADATSAGQVVGAAVLDTLGILFGGYSNVSATVDAVQEVKASVITKPSLEGNKMVVRVTFQRIVWNKNKQINRIETVKETEIYQKFYEDLSKAIFLEAQKI